MDLLNLILFIVVANTVPFTGIALSKQNMVLLVASALLGFDQTCTIYWLDGTICIYGEASQQVMIYSNAITPDQALGVSDKSTQLSSLNKFIAFNKSTNTMYLHMNFLHMEANDFRVFIDGYLANWDPDLRCFKVHLGAEDITPRIDNISLIEDKFNGVTFEVRTNGVPIQHLKYV